MKYSDFFKASLIGMLRPAIFSIMLGSMFLGCGEGSFDIESRSAESLDELKESIKSGYLNGDHYTVIAYMNNESLEPDLAHAIAQTLSLGANQSNDAKVALEIISWEGFQNTSGIPGNFKGKELAFSDTPEGIIKIVTTNEEAGFRYAIDLAYFSRNGIYRLCGVGYK